MLNFVWLFSMRNTFFRSISYSFVIKHWLLFRPICYSFIFLYILDVKVSCFMFSFLMLWCISYSTSVFSFFNQPILFIFAPNFRHSWLVTSNIFGHCPLWLVNLNEFYDLFIASIDSSFFKPSFFLISNVQPFGKVCKSCLLTAGGYAYLGFC